MRPGRSLGRDRAGTTTVEFALLGTVLCFLLLGTLEFGRWLWTMQALQSTASEAARCMAVLDPGCAASGSYSATTAIRHVKSVASAWGVTLTSDQITLNRAASIGSISGFSEVSLSYPFQSVVAGFVPGLNGTSTIVAQAFVPNWQ
jgi:Flp pilus assembly protein TadG